MVEKSSLKELKKDYEKLRQKYKLPSFQLLNEEFDIEKVTEHETECLLREVRKAIMDKVIVYLRFIEMMLNPSNAPLFFFALVKGLNHQEKKDLEELYEKLGSFEIEVIELDCMYSEKKEAEFINRAFKQWLAIKKDVLKLVKILKRNWSQKSKKDERDYFG